MARRLTRVRHNLTLDLYLQQGPFWDAIRKLREKWDIVPQCTMPPPRSDFAYVPPVCAGLAALGFQWMTDGPAALHLIEWVRDQYNVYTRVIPEDCRLGGANTWVNWAQFIAMCTLFDPPEDRLLDFADHLPFVPATLRTAPSAEASQPGAAGRPPGPGIDVPAPPIAFVRNGHQVEDLMREYFDRVIAEVQRQAPPGFDVQGLVKRIMEDPDVENTLQAGLEQTRSGPYLVVTPFTNQEDIKVLVQLIKERRGWPVQGGRSSLDDLTAVQSAIYEQQGWTQRQIADHFKWERLPASYDLVPRSNTTRNHLRRGRELLRRQNNSAE